MQINMKAVTSPTLPWIAATLLAFKPAGSRVRFRTRCMTLVHLHKQNPFLHLSSIIVISQHKNTNSSEKLCFWNDFLSFNIKLLNLGSSNFKLKHSIFKQNTIPEKTLLFFLLCIFKKKMESAVVRQFNSEYSISYC